MVPNGFANLLDAKSKESTGLNVLGFSHIPWDFFLLVNLGVLQEAASFCNQGMGSNDLETGAFYKFVCP